MMLAFSFSVSEVESEHPVMVRLRQRAVRMIWAVLFISGRWVVCGALAAGCQPPEQGQGADYKRSASHMFDPGFVAGSGFVADGFIDLECPSEKLKLDLLAEVTDTDPSAAKG